MTPRNDFRHSHTWADATYEDRRIAELERGPLHSPEHPLRAELGRNAYGGFFAWLRGWGYPTIKELPDFDEQPRAAEYALDALVAHGYALQDPGHLIELFDLFPDEPVSQYEDSRDAAESPAMAMACHCIDYVQRALELQDADVIGEIECAYLRTTELVL